MVVRPRTTGTLDAWHLSTWRRWRTSSRSGPSFAGPVTSAVPTGCWRACASWASQWTTTRRPGLWADAVSGSGLTETAASRPRDTRVRRIPGGRPRRRSRPRPRSIGTRRTRARPAARRRSPTLRRLRSPRPWPNGWRRSARSAMPTPTHCLPSSVGGACAWLTKRASGAPTAGRSPPSTRKGTAGRAGEARPLPRPRSLRSRLCCRRAASALASPTLPLSLTRPLTLALALSLADSPTLTLTSSLTRARALSDLIRTLT